MALVPVELPTLDVMRGLLAAYSAVVHATGSGDGSAADGPVWHYDDFGGNWADVVLLDGGKAVLLGWERSGSTYFRGAAAEFGEDETDLLAGAPDWWNPVVAAAERPYHWIGFVYGFDGERWWRAAYDADDAFASLGFPGRSAEDCRAECADFADGFDGDRGELPDEIDPAALDAVVAAGVDVTEAQLVALLGADGDAAAGVAAARRFVS